MSNPALSSSPVRLRLYYLDGLRGLAALFVVLHHAYYGVTSEFTLPSQVAHLTYWLFLGRSAVDIFIVLSGYCLMLPVAQAHADALPGGVTKFFQRRARRILPPYYAAMGVTLLAIAGLPILRDRLHPEALWATALPAFTPDVILSHLFLVHNFDPAWHSKINYPFWSVATEWQIYFLFPWMLLPLRRRFGIGAAVLGAFVVGFGLLSLFFGRFSGVAPQFLGLFALGMAGAELNFAVQPEPVRRCERWPWGWLSVALGVSLCVLSLLHTRWPLLVAVKDVFVGGATVCLLIFCTRHLTRAVDSGRMTPGRAPLVLRLLESRQAVALGAFSYSLYLMHAPVLAVCQAVLRPLGLSPTVFLSLMLSAGVLLAVLVSYLFYLLFERPFLRRRDRQEKEMGQAKRQTSPI